MRPQMLMLLSLALTAIALSGCSPAGPDLAPVDPPGEPPFCDLDAGNLKVHVKNQGTTDATGSEVEVEFSMGSGVHKTVRGATGPITKDATDVVLVAIPEGCFNPDCYFKITVDIVNEVKESNEQNNSAEGWCIG